MTFDEWFDLHHKANVDAAESIRDADSTYYLMRQAWEAAFWAGYTQADDEHNAINMHNNAC
jgi:hypothetical protein